MKQDQTQQTNTNTNIIYKIGKQLFSQPIKEGIEKSFYDELQIMQTAIQQNLHLMQENQFLKTKNLELSNNLTNIMQENQHLTQKIQYLESLINNIQVYQNIQIVPQGQFELNLLLNTQIVPYISLQEQFKITNTGLTYEGFTNPELNQI